MLVPIETAFCIHRNLDFSGLTMLDEVSFGNSGMSCCPYRQNIFVDEKIRWMACVKGTQGLVPYANVEEAGRDHLWVEGEVLRTHHRRHHPEVCWTQQIHGYFPHMFVHLLVVHRRGIYGVLVFEEIHRCRASVNTCLFHNYLLEALLHQLNPFKYLLSMVARLAVIYRATNLFNSLKKMIEACVRESPESPTNYNTIRYHVKLVTSIKSCNGHHLFS